jgi:hypothetical protein
VVSLTPPELACQTRYSAEDPGLAFLAFFPFRREFNAVVDFRQQQLGVDFDERQERLTSLRAQANRRVGWQSLVEHRY